MNLFSPAKAALLSGKGSFMPAGSCDRSQHLPQQILSTAGHDLIIHDNSSPRGTVGPASQQPHHRLPCTTSPPLAYGTSTYPHLKIAPSIVQCLTWRHRPRLPAPSRPSSTGTKGAAGAARGSSSSQRALQTPRRRLRRRQLPQERRRRWTPGYTGLTRTKVG